MIPFVKNMNSYSPTFLSFVAWVALISALPLMAAPVRDAAWFEKRHAFVERAKADPSEKNVNDLIENFHYMGFHLKGASDEFLALAEEMRQTLAAIPTLPDQLHARILKARAEQQAQPTQQYRDAMYYESVQKVVPYFDVLSNLKTPASVRVLGDLLSDHRGAYDPDSIEDIEDLRWAALVRTSNSQYAIIVLMASALENKPLVIPPSRKYSRPTREQIAVWERWYERIKAGNATFRFEGDPTEYDLDGPASPEKLARIRANRQRDEDREQRQRAAAALPGGAAPAAPSAAETSLAFPWLGAVLGGLAVLSSLAWYILRRGKTPEG